MKLEDLTIGLRVKGPRGAVYVVTGFTEPKPMGMAGFGRWAILESDESTDGRIEVDQQALDEFIPWEGEPLCS